VHTTGSSQIYGERCFRRVINVGINKVVHTNT
jgi:hypothetical protein